MNLEFDLIFHLRNNIARLFSVRLRLDCQCKMLKKFAFRLYSRFRFRFEYFRYCFIIVFASIFVSIFVFVNDSNVFSLTTIFVFVSVNEINTDIYIYISMVQHRCVVYP